MLPESKPIKLLQEMKIKNGIAVKWKKKKSALRTLCAQEPESEKRGKDRKRGFVVMKLMLMTNWNKSVWEKELFSRNEKKIVIRIIGNLKKK